MQVRIEDVSRVEKKLVVEVPWAMVSQRLGAAYRKLAQGVQIRGFRRGKVPRSVLERMFGKRIRAEVASELVNESFATATSEHSLQAVARPVVEEEVQIKSGEPFAFEAKVEVKTEVVAKDYRGLELEKRPLRVSDEAMNAALEEIRVANTELLPIEGRDVTARTDVLTVTLKGSVGEQSVDTEKLSIDLSDSEREALPGILDALTGIPLDAADHAFSLTMPEDFSEAALAGKEASLTVTIAEARRKEIPELDDELAKDTGDAETLEELKNVVRNRLEKAEEKKIRQELEEATLNELVKRNDIPVAPSLLDRAVQMHWNRMGRMFGMDEKALNSPVTGELREKLEPNALREVRGQLLLEALAEQEKIEVDDKDIDNYVEELAKEQGTPALRLRANLDQGGQLDGIRFQLRHEKALNFVIENSTVTEVEPPPPEEKEDASPSEESPSATPDTSKEE